MPQLTHGNLNADRTRTGGEAIDLGGFMAMVHRHDRERRMRLKIEVDATNDELPNYAARGHYGSPWDTSLYPDLDDTISSIWLQLEIGWSLALRAPQVFAYEIGLNGGDEPTLRIEAGPAAGQQAMLSLAVTTPIFARADDDGDTAMSRCAEAAGAVVKDGVAVMALFAQTSAIPTWGQPLQLHAEAGFEPIDDDRRELWHIVTKIAVGAGELVVRQLERMRYIGPLRAVPSRNYRPPLSEDASRWADGLGAWDALHAAPSLTAKASTWMGRLRTGYRIESRMIREVTLAAPSTRGPGPGNTPKRARGRTPGRAPRGNSPGEMKRVVGGTKSNVDSVRLDDIQRVLTHVLEGGPDAASKVGDLNLGPNDRAILRQALEDLTTSKERRELVLVDERSGVSVQPSDVGVGISQVLPVVVGALYRRIGSGAGAFVVVEQPELHIHPRLQVELADLFIEQATSGTVSDHQFLLETHSEHLVLRFMRRLREAAMARKDRAEEKGGATAGPTPGHLGIIYVQRSQSGGAEFVPIRVDEDGEFLDVWPEGFFEERVQERFG